MIRWWVSPFFFVRGVAMDSSLCSHPEPSLSGLCVVMLQDPDDGTLHTIRLGDKVCDVLYRWENLTKEMHTGRLSNINVPRLTFKKRIFSPKQLSM